MSDALTLRCAFDRYYLPQHPGAKKTSIRTTRYRIRCWERVTSNPDLRSLTRADFDNLRPQLIDAGYAAASIESLIAVVRSICEACVEEGLMTHSPRTGNSLKVRPGDKWTPETKDLSAIYRVVGAAQWPVRRVPRGQWSSTAAASNGGFVRLFSTDHWWRTLFVAGYFTALRRADLLDLRWSDIRDDRIVRTMAKTEYAVEIPIHAILRAHLDRMPHESDRVFGDRNNSHKQFERELHAMSRDAKIGPFTMQSLRRLSARSWESARAGAGACILGHRIRGAAANYLHAFRILQDAIPALVVPDAMRPVTAPDPFVTVISTDWGMPA
ncbi:MAG TPA: hypothetical protein VFG04_08935 [Planctomycetaceae bacterium]|jgi:integrase|nr:hypothetical protein [Planctomycetaceae bacterium]